MKQQAPQGTTRPKVGGQPAPRLPHERDESSDSQADTGNDVDGQGRRAYDDHLAGRVDTDLGPVLDRVARRLRRQS